MKFLNKFSLKLRLTLLFALIFTASLSTFSFILYKEFTKIQSEVFDTTLYNYAVDVAESLDFDSYGDVEFDPEIIKLNEKILPFKLGRSYITVMDTSGNIIARSSNVKANQVLVVNDLTLTKVLEKGASFDEIVFNSLPHRVINYLLPVLKIDSPLILQITVPRTAYFNTTKNFKRFFYVAIPAIMILSSFVGYFFVGRALTPMMEVINKAKKIEITNLKDRVPEPVAKDEIWQLADTINNLLSKLDISIKSQERFIQDASHQLKTPLTIMKGELELYKSSKMSVEESINLSESLLQEVNSLIKLTNDLLILARVESGNLHFDFTETRVDEIILSQISRLSKLASMKKISLQIDFDSFENTDEKNLLVFCDPDLLGVLFYNLIENAIKYSPLESCILISGHVESDFIFISIVDEGIGIKSGDEENIFKRFYRVEGSSKIAVGSGLGLAISNLVAESIGAKIWASNNETKGSTFHFKIKRIV